MLKYCLTLAFLVCAAGAQAQTYHVSNGGNDSVSCTQATNINTPKLTIANAVANCGGAAGTEQGAGKTVQVAPGTYSEAIPQPPSGSGSSAKFTLTCAIDRLCILRPPAASYGLGFNAASHWIVVRGFFTDRGKGWYFSGSAVGQHHHIEFLNNEVSGATMAEDAMGLQASAADLITVRGNKIYGLRSTAGGVPNGLSHAIYASDRTTNWVIEDNEIFDNGAYGIHVYGTGSTVPTGFTIRRNLTYRNGTTGVNGTGIVADGGGGHNITHNVVYENRNEGILLRSVVGSINVDNNTVHGNVFGGIVKEHGATVNCRNNLALANGSGQINGCDSESGNIVSGSAASHFVNAGAGDFRLIATSSAIDGGGDIGLPCNAGCAVGAFDPPALIAVEVGSAGANKIRLTFDVDAAPPLQATNFASGWTSVKGVADNPVISAALLGNALIELTVQNNFLSTDKCSVSYAAGVGLTNLSDSARIGGIYNQDFHSRSNVPCANNVTPGGAAVLTQISYRVRELYGSETAAGWKTTLENTPYDVVVGGAGRVRVKGKAENSDPPPFNLGVLKRITTPAGVVGAKTVLGNACSASDPVCFYGTGTALGVTHNAPTTEQLAGTLANASCPVLLLNSSPAIDPGINTEWECEIAFKFDPSLPKGSRVEIFLTRDGGAEFESYAQTATLNVIDNQYVDGG